jgi:hypothetical protein
MQNLEVSDKPGQVLYFTEEELRKYNGATESTPIYVAVKGKVIFSVAIKNGNLMQIMLPIFCNNNRYAFSLPKSNFIAKEYFLDRDPS